MKHKVPRTSEEIHAAGYRFYRGWCYRSQAHFGRPRAVQLWHPLPDGLFMRECETGLEGLHGFIDERIDRYGRYGLAPGEISAHELAQSPKQLALI